MLFRILPLIALFLLMPLQGLLNAQENMIYTDPDTRYKSAIDWYQRGNYTLAKKEFRTFLSETQYDHGEDWTLRRETALYLQAMSAQKLGNPDAVLSFIQIISQYPGRARLVAECNFQIAQHYFESKKYKNAIAYYDKVDVSYLGPEYLQDYYFRQAYSYFIFKKFDQAQPLFEQIANFNNDYKAAANYYVGYIAFENKDYDKAMSSFQTIEKDKLYSKTVPYYITQIYHTWARSDELIDYAVPVLKRPGLKFRKEINNILGQTYYDQKRFEEALPYLEYYVKNSNKVRKEDLYQLAYTQYKFGKYGDAISNFKDLNTLNDTIGQNAQYHLAACYLKTGEKDQARNAFASASKMSFDPVIQETSAFNHAKLSYELGFDGEAVEALRTFIALYPSSNRSYQAKDLLGEVLENYANYGEAMKIIESIPDRSPRMNQTYQKMACYKGIDLCSNGKYDQALPMFDKAIQNNKNPELGLLAKYWKGDIYFRQNKYPQAITAMSEFKNGGRNISDKVSIAMADYTIGYSYLNQKNYSSAGSSFSKVVDALQGKSGKLQTQIATDAMLRGGDCYFVSGDYSKASGIYQKVLNKGGEGADYATYQKGLIAGLQRDKEGKLRLMREVETKYPNSAFRDDAVFQIGQTYLTSRSYSDAISTFKRLVDSFPDSDKRAQALINLGLINYNTNNNSEAIKYYEQVIRKYPKSAESQAALSGLQDVYIASGDSEGFRKKMKSLGVDVSSSQADAVAFQAAESYYDKGDCTGTISSLNRYLRDFPNGGYIVYAHFYRAECLYESGGYLDAIKDYDAVIRNGNDLFMERALEKAARIAYHQQKDYAKANEYYAKLESNSLKRTYSLEAVRGLMRTAFKLKKTQQIDKYTQALLLRQDATENDQIEANFYAGRSMYDRGSLSKAIEHLSKVAALTTNDMGSEARYLIADANKRQNRWEKCKEYAYKVINEAPGNETWFVRSYLLLADYYEHKGELYQAKQTLLSIKNGYKGSDQSIIKDVDQKLSIIIGKEKAKTKLQSPDSNKPSEYLETEEIEEGN